MNGCRFLRAMVILLLSCCCGASAATVTVLDVGFGLAVHIDAGAFHALIDAGTAGTSGRIVGHFREARIDRIDLLILTHLHPDHAGGAAAIIDALRPATVWWNGSADGDAAMAALAREVGRRCVPVVPAAGVRLPLGEGATLTVLGGGDRGDANDRALALLLESGGWRVLLPSDAGPSRQRGIAADAPLEGGRIDLLVWPHHGDALDPTFAEALGRVPACAVSVGSNPHGLPSPGLDGDAAGLCDTLFRTDHSGNLTFRPAATGGGR